MTPQTPHMPWPLPPTLSNIRGKTWEIRICCKDQTSLDILYLDLTLRFISASSLCFWKGLDRFWAPIVNPVTLLSAIVCIFFISLQIAGLGPDMDGKKRCNQACVSSNTDTDLHCAWFDGSDSER